jgi:hypothetical protein
VKINIDAVIIAIAIFVVIVLISNMESCTASLF